LSSTDAGAWAHVVEQPTIKPNQTRPTLAFKVLASVPHNPSGFRLQGHPAYGDWASSSNASEQRGSPFHFLSMFLVAIALILGQLPLMLPDFKTDN
jgi:hypothetical protein